MSDREANHPHRDRLEELYRELRDTEDHTRAVPAVQLHGIPGRRSEKSLICPWPEHRWTLRELQKNLGVVLERMRRETMPIRRWITLGRRLVYLDPLPDFDRGPEGYELHEVPARPTPVYVDCTRPEMALCDTKPGPEPGAAA